jgi:inner membrane protein
MPSLFTHAFTGAALSTLAPREVRGVELGAILAGIAALPDLDVIGLHFGIPYGNAFGHRGFSHSLTFALLAAIAVWLWMARGRTLGSRAGAGLFAVAFVAGASHGFLDAFTDAGLGVGFFVPFSDRRYFFPWRPIRTSPLSIAGFFTHNGVVILRNELGWVWLPVGLGVALVVAARYAVAAGANRRPPAA